VQQKETGEGEGAMQFDSQHTYHLPSPPSSSRFEGHRDGKLHIPPNMAMGGGLPFPMGGHSQNSSMSSTHSSRGSSSFALGVGTVTPTRSTSTNSVQGIGSSTSSHRSFSSLSSSQSSGLRKLRDSLSGGLTGLISKTSPSLSHPHQLPYSRPTSEGPTAQPGSPLALAEAYDRDSGNGVASIDIDMLVHQSTDMSDSDLGGDGTIPQPPNGFVQVNGVGVVVGADHKLQNSIIYSGDALAPLVREASHHGSDLANLRGSPTTDTSR
jgi:hypothetical protein